jgi:hypothetical protein
VVLQVHVVAREAGRQQAVAGLFRGGAVGEGAKGGVHVNSLG